MSREVLERIQSRLQALDISESRAALDAGLSDSAIRNVRRAIEKGRKAGFAMRTLEALAPVLKTSVAWLAEEAGTPEGDRPPTTSDVAPFDPTSHDLQRYPALRSSLKVARALGEGHQIHIRRISTDCLALAGYMPGDFALIDYRAPEAAAAGAIVEAQVEESTGEWETVLRRLQPPALMPASQNPDHRPFIIGPQTQLRGVLIASWRLAEPEPLLIEGSQA